MLLSDDIDISKVVELLKREYNRRAEFSPLEWSKGMKLHVKEVYTKLRVVSRSTAGSSEIDVDDIFGSSEEDNDPLVLVEGNPGISKTTFCLKLAYDWATGTMPRNFPSFKLVFLLKCRDMKGDVVKDIFEQLLPEDLKENTKGGLVNTLENLIRIKFASFWMVWTSSQNNQEIVWTKFLAEKNYHLATCWPQHVKKKELIPGNNLNLIVAWQLKDLVKIIPLSS